MVQVENLALFTGLAESELQKLFAAGKQRSVAKGETLFLYGDKIKHFYIVKSGVFKLGRTTPEGQHKTLDILKAGEAMCAAEIMDSCHGHRMTAEAVENSEVVEFPAMWLKDSVRNHPDFALNLLSAISSRAHMAEVEAEHQATMSAPQLVACFLQRISILHGFDPKGFELPYSKALIASRLGMEQETFSRTLNKLKDHGIIVSGNHVSIHDLEKIERYLCNFCSIADDCSTHKSISKLIG